MPQDKRAFYVFVLLGATLGLKWLPCYTTQLLKGKKDRSHMLKSKFYDQEVRQDNKHLILH